MIRAIEAVVDEGGHVQLAEPVALKGSHRALVIILEERPSETMETAILSEQSLAVDWMRSEEEEAWSFRGINGA